ncbi:MAG: CPBP family glutamic-type intramembrane protease, partial [Pseudomonadota bacterium]
FLVTGAGGWMFAFAYAKTRSLFAPTGLHLGWNLVAAVVFSSGPIGNQWLVQQGEGAYASEWITLLFFALQTIVAPGLVTWYLLKFYRPRTS